MDVSFITSLVADIGTASYFIIGSCFLAMAIGFCFMYIMKLCAGVITWLAIILILVLVAALTYFMYDL